jgi:hypothetical protein
MKTKIATLIASLLTASLPAQTVLLDNFNTGTASGAVISGTSWVGQVTQGATSLTVAGTAKDDNGWGATFSAVNVSGMNYLNITAQRDAGNVAPTLSIQLLDENLNSEVFTTPTSSFLVGAMSTVSIAISSWGSLDPARITDWNIGGGGVGTVAFRMTFDNLALSAAAIPEPSAVAALAGVAALGLAALRRYRVKRTV